MEQTGDKKIYRLAELNRSIQRLIEKNTAHLTLWVKAEIAQSKQKNGHMYLELAEEVKGQIAAKMQAVIWRSDLENIRRDLGDDFNDMLKPGREVVFRVAVNFHLVYGLKLQIFEVDLSYTLGEIERRKQESLRALAAEDLVDRNKLLPLPLVIQRIALIGASDSAGWADFTDHLKKNPEGFEFSISPYPTQVQGKEAAVLIKARLEEAWEGDFDAIIILRGGGSPIDLDVFNDYHLAKAIALSPLPVLTGIGHETDMHVADLVAHEFFKTPTAVADFLIDRAHDFTLEIWTLFDSIRQSVERRIEASRHHFELVRDKICNSGISYTQLRRGELASTANKLRHSTIDRVYSATQTLNRSASALREHSLIQIKDNRADLQDFEKVVRSSALQNIRKEEERLGRLKSTINTIHPNNLLKLGLAMIRKNGTVLGPDSTIKVKEELDLHLYQRDLKVEVKKISPWKKSSPTKRPSKNSGKS